MTVTRKEFLKKACMSGVCICGAGQLMAAHSHAGVAVTQEQNSKNPNALQQEWISILLNDIDDRIPPEDLRRVLRGCAISHYNSLGMNAVIEPFKGKTDEFIIYLSNEWGWKVNYDKTEGIIVVDENKDHCVCPMVNKEKSKVSPSICYCSEGFIAKMFSEVTGREVKAEVLASIHRGDPSCKYKVVLG